ncbi:hypothetical protein TNCT_440811 [Trichonephila clavata]|uniref:Uncharacterized protein n=1 Tax=Trichonephila clavata TaxID=2740835 RepID=A0A8X6HJ31_TRICU|nr:hypothetical protein TNCT_440811 [Trichonephila clavata]
MFDLVNEEPLLNITLKQKDGFQSRETARCPCGFTECRVWIRILDSHDWTLGRTTGAGSKITRRMGSCITVGSLSTGGEYWTYNLWVFSSLVARLGHRESSYAFSTCFRSLFYSAPDFYMVHDRQQH